MSAYAQNMVGPGEVDDELESETAEECGKYGKVIKCLIFEVSTIVQFTWCFYSCIKIRLLLSQARFIKPVLRTFFHLSANCEL